MTELSVSDTPKMLMETLCEAEASIGRAPLLWDDKQRHLARIRRLMDECERLRPTGPDGKHGDLHTPGGACGCAPEALKTEEKPDGDSTRDAGPSEKELDEMEAWDAKARNLVMRGRAAFDPCGLSVYADRLLDAANRNEVLRNEVRRLRRSGNAALGLRAFRDGDQMCVVLHDFVNLQESPAIFLPMADGWAGGIEREGIGSLPDWIRVRWRRELERRRSWNR